MLFVGKYLFLVNSAQSALVSKQVLNFELSGARVLGSIHCGLEWLPTASNHHDDLTFYSFSALLGHLIVILQA